MKRDELIFERPAELAATRPAAARGQARDAGRLLVSTRRGHQHARFADLGQFLQAGDLLVVNRSATVPASLPAIATGLEFILNLSTDYGGGPRIIDSYGGASLHAQFHGESFLSLLMHRFSSDGFYILDEPEAALSPTRQMSALARLHQLVQADSQFVISTHSPILMAYPNAWIYSLDDEGIKRISYEETEHYQVTRDFLNNYEMMLGMLLAD